MKLVLELERFFPDLKCFLSKDFLKDYNRQTEKIVSRKRRFYQMKDILSKVSIWSNFENRDEAGGTEGTMERLVDNQRDLEKLVRSLTSQLSNLMEETAEMKEMISKLEVKDRRTKHIGQKFAGSRIIANYDKTKL